ncbi:M24 family metallopeptidase [Neobacillus notoginsengisoli]|uniref:M24 family metallopeptidase n=1 Tax=Neobacillus notoginsengisoli TaxID=1578198 RepID=UPI00115EF883|nr:Xaa-Pro peptidase family protein [Neobacillus notoginsengisoli]
MTNRIKISDSEYKERLKRAAKLVEQKGLDVLLVNSNEADFSNARYFSGYWPIFETSGVAISADGQAALLIGPESKAYAEDVSKIENIFMLKEYRESADPAYPELQTNTYRDVFRSIGLKGDKLKIGIGGYLVTTLPMLDGLRQEYPDAEIVRADDIMVELRSIKSENEILCLRESFRITEIAMDNVIKNISPGMTELQLVGLAQQAIYENGAEYEGMPMYVFSGKSTRHAISRPTHRQIREGDIIQLNLSARVDGYSCGIGTPVSLGKMSTYQKDIVEFALEAHNWTKAQLKEGVLASDIAQGYINLFKSKGKSENYLYGPCHGLGMIEVEPPWMETTSDYQLRKNMTFQIDTFVSTPDFGVRWETGAVITESGCSLLSNPLSKIHELMF